MFINRNNYETFFLLYADDELCAAERIAVENFIKANKDLRGELNMILSAILPADDFSFIDKDLLYQNSFVDGSLQEKLLLKMDNELSPEELSALNKIILIQPTAIQEENLLLSTRLTSTEIVTCPQKGLLFKREKNFVVVFSILRWAAAAIFIGFSLFFGLNIYNKKTLPDNPVVIKENIKDDQNEADILHTKQTENRSFIKADSTIARKESKQKTVNIIAAQNLAANKQDKIEKEFIEKTLVVNEKALASTQEVKKLISPADNITAQNINQPQIASTIKPEKLQMALTNENIAPLETSYAQTVLLTDTKTNNNKILYLDEEDVKRSKVGTIFKQLKRMIERTAKIKSANPIRIAGFQIGAD